jgi:hypothetical protein
MASETTHQNDETSRLGIKQLRGAGRSDNVRRELGSSRFNLDHSLIRCRLGAAGPGRSNRAQVRYLKRCGDRMIFIMINNPSESHGEDAMIEVSIALREYVFI